MRVASLNPQGNFDPDDFYWTAHPDFGGQLVYVKELALAMGNLGHRVDIVTRRIVDPEWPEFASETDAYPDAPNVRILRIPCGPDTFLAKEELWPYLGTEFVPQLLDLYEAEGSLPDVVTSHYGDGGLCAALIEEQTGIPFSFTAHSSGAQKMDKMRIPRTEIAEVDARYHFSSRLVAERLAMNRSNVNVTSTSQERFNQYTHNAYRGADALLAVRQVDEEIISRASIVHTSAFALSRDPQRLAVRRAMRLGSRLGKIVTLDPNCDPRVWPDKVEAWEVLAEIMPYVTIVKPSLEVVRRLFDVNMDEETLEETVPREFHDLGANTVILTRSGGVVTVSEHGNVERVGPLPKVKIENVTGARDAFWSALLMATSTARSGPRPCASPTRSLA